MGSQMPEIDPHQDWFLNNARENGTHTILRFSRDFDTLDDQDYPITVCILWKFVVNSTFFNISSTKCGY